MTRLIRFNKPYDVLPQFTDRGSEGAIRPTLSAYVDCPGVYPAGRLDRDSEGLMLLTDDGRLQAFISDPKHKLEKTYWVQVEGRPDHHAIKALCTGVELKDGLTRPAKARQIDEPDGLWARTPPIRERKAIPTSWLQLTISEGKNRQVRRMTAAVGLPTLRLIRCAIGAWSLEGLAQGKWDDLDPPRVPGPPKPSYKPPRHKKLAQTSGRRDTAATTARGPKSEGAASSKPRRPTLSLSQKGSKPKR